MIKLPFRRRRSRLHTQRSRLRQESLEPRVVLDSTVVFSEIMYHPPESGEPQAEWIEFYNQLAVDMDISDWVLEGGVDYKFPDGAVVPGRGHLVVASNPEALEQATGLTNVYGPWSGQLNNGGEELRLFNNDARLMNQIEYGDTGAWPAAPDGGGSSLAKANREGASDKVENWTYSVEIGGTPGRKNFIEAGDYLTTILIDEAVPARALVPSDGSLALDWTAVGFDDSGWTHGTTGVGFDTRGTLDPLIGLDLDSPPDGQPPISMRNINASVYVRIPFELNQEISQFDEFTLNMQYDDGFVAFLNGVEIAHSNAPGRDGEPGELQWNSDATGSNSATRSPIDIDLKPFQDLFQAGQNVLAIQGMNTSLTSSDMVVLPVLEGRTALEPITASPVVINEITAADAEEWFVEILNPSAETADLGNLVFRLSGDANAQYSLAGRSLGPGELLSISSQQLGFLPQDGDRLFLTSVDGTQMVDARRVTGRLRGRSDENQGAWMYPSSATPGEANVFQFHDEIVINEIMYHPMPKLAIPDTPPTYDRSTLVSMTHDQWRYNANGASLPTGWAQQVYEADGTEWKVGQGLIGYETSDLGVPINTQLTKPGDNDPRFLTYYFQTSIELTAEQLDDVDVLELSHMIDAGAIFYLNGEELLRFNMRRGPGRCTNEGLAQRQQRQPGRADGNPDRSTAGGHERAVGRIAHAHRIQQ